MLFRSVVAVPQYCTVTQLQNQTFITGGNTPSITNAVSEFIMDTQRLIRKSSMNYAKYCHRTEAISTKHFITIGGENGLTAIPHCEEYSVDDDKWIMLPPLNKARYCTGSALLGKYVYVIGGRGTTGEIERLDLTEKKHWAKIVPITAEITFTSDTLAFATSSNEISIFRGGNPTEVSVFDVKEQTVKKNVTNLKTDFYRFSSVCYIGHNIYIIGHNGHIHIYKTADKKFEDIDYQDVMTN